VTPSCKYRVSPDNFLVLNQGQNYESYIDSDETVESFAVFFRPEYASIVLDSLTVCTEKLVDNPFPGSKLEKRVWFYERLYAKDNRIVPLLLNIRKRIAMGESTGEEMYFLLECLMTTHKDVLSEIQRVNSVKSSTRSEVYRRINIAKDYIESGFGENISLGILAKAACMNKYHLLRTFKNFYGITPYQYLKQVRLNEAKRLLDETTKSVSQISAHVGFEFLSSFSQLFYNCYKLSPGAYRKLKPSQKVNIK
jgi:AraC-like DNA-binding protein